MKPSEREKDRLVHQGFRLEQEVLKLLQNEADRRGVSLSNLVNKTLKNHITRDIYFEELRFIPLSRHFLKKVFDKLEDQEYLEEIGAELGLTIAKEYVSYFFPEVSPDTLIEFLDMWLGKFQSYQHRLDPTNEQIHTFTVNHDINTNFTIVLEAILQGLIEPLIKAVVRFTNKTPNQLSFSFEL